MKDGSVTPLNTTDRPAFSADGKSLAFVARDGDVYKLMVGSAADPARATALRTGPERMEAAALSPDGARVAYELMTNDDWEIYTAARDGSGEQRLTREIQHDLQPQFLGAGKLLGVIGEARHRRSYLYDLATGTRTRLFHNNTVRTIAPEYSWTPSADGTRLLISAERDGDTVSPQRGVYVMDLTHTVTKEELRARVAASLAGEKALHAKGQRLYGPIAADVKAVVADASVSRVYGYEKTLFDFDSKHITKPGNKLASAYLLETYRSFGYDAELQWFEPRAALDGRSANVVATLKGTVNPELIYVVSSHYDSVAVGPGADDDSSGTAALLETARMMAGHPQPATIIFASFTGEEAGLLGSREFVRQAVANKLQVVGALNNDMVGWANDYRLDNTIRYSNPGIRDVQHARGDAVHEPDHLRRALLQEHRRRRLLRSLRRHRRRHRLVSGARQSALSPAARLPGDDQPSAGHRGGEDDRGDADAAGLEPVAAGRPEGGQLQRRNADALVAPRARKGRHRLHRRLRSARQARGPDRPGPTKPSIALSNIAPGTVVSVKAINAKGMEGWDWATVAVK